jgi:hypothetical protein
MPNVGRKPPDKAHEQSIVFEKDEWKEPAARAWCKSHGYYTDGMDEMENTYRFRQFDPDAGKFNYRNKAVGKGITFVLAFPKGARTADDFEVRTYALEEIAVGDAGETSPGTATGHFARFNELSVGVPWGRERIAPGAFTATIARDDIRALVNHDANRVLGRTTQGTLRLREDDIGGAFDDDLPDTSYARDLAVLLRRGDVSQCSFGFWPVRDHIETDNEEQIRVLDEVRLAEITIATFPAYPATEAQLRSVLTMVGASDPDELKDEILALMSGSAAADLLNDAERIALRALRARVDLLLADRSRLVEGTLEETRDEGAAWKADRWSRMLRLADLHARRRS